MTSALTEEAVLPTLHNLILTEVYLSGGPVDVFRLWSEMYERQKTIAVGTLLFVRAIAHLEQQGFLQKVSESKSAITGKGEAYLASTGNILDVSVRGDYLPYEGMSSPAVTRDCPNRGRDLSANSSAATPLYLLASEIVDKVTKGYEQ